MSIDTVGPATRILVSKTLKEYDLLLSGHSFFRVQQSHLVNLDFIDRYDKVDGGAVIMKDGINADRDATDYKREVKTITSGDKLKIQLSKGGGWTARIEKK